MNCGQFKDPVSQMCLACTVVASWCLTQEMARLNPFMVMTNIFTARKRSLRRLCFYRCVSVYGGGMRGMYPPADTTAMAYGQ